MPSIRGVENLSTLRQIVVAVIAWAGTNVGPGQRIADAPIHRVRTNHG
jgi:hypothetical protein